MEDAVAGAVPELECAIVKACFGILALAQDAFKQKLLLERGVLSKKRSAAANLLNPLKPP